MRKKYAIIEDEEFARLNLQNMIESIRTDYELVFTADSVEDAVNYFRTQPQLDLAFIDVELTDNNSFEIFRQVEVKVPLVFTTAYDDFALQAFQVNSIDYLLKPYTETDLERALTKYDNLISHSKSPEFDYSKLLQELAHKTRRTRFLVSSGNNYFYAEIDDVSFFIRDEKYVYAVLRDGHRHITDFQNLSEVTDIVDESRFFQISRNIIACITSINKVSKYFAGRLEVEVGTGQEQQIVVVSAARRGDFLNWLGEK